jgi:hypothetical protein
VGKNKMKTFKFHFDFVHFVIVLIFFYPFLGKWGKKKMTNFIVAKAKWAKSSVAKKQNFPIRNDDGWSILLLPSIGNKCQ